MKTTKSFDLLQNNKKSKKKKLHENWVLLKRGEKKKPF